MRNVPVGSETRARHIGWISVPTFSTSVITPTTKTRFTLAPSGVTTYEGARSPPPSISRVASLYSDAKSRQATSRITRIPPAPRAFRALRPGRPPSASSPSPRSSSVRSRRTSRFPAPPLVGPRESRAGPSPRVDRDPSPGAGGAPPSFGEVLDPQARARVQPVGGGKRVRFDPGDPPPLVNADLGDAPPRLDVGPLDSEDLF